MALKNQSELEIQADIIKSESAIKANTAGRIGQMLIDFIQSVYNVKVESSDITNAINALKASVPTGGDNLNKLYLLISALDSRITPPIQKNYIDTAALIADQGVLPQGLGNIYSVGTQPNLDYYEYLGTTVGDITDYSQIDGIEVPVKASESDVDTGTNDEKFITPAVLTYALDGLNSSYNPPPPYATIAALLADQGAQTENVIYEVTDASTDTTVTSGAAWYRKTAASTADLDDYVKRGEEEAFSEGLLAAYITSNNDAVALKQDILAEGPFVDGDKTKLDATRTAVDEDKRININADWETGDLVPLKIRMRYDFRIDSFDPLAPMTLTIKESDGTTDYTPGDTISAGDYITVTPSQEGVAFIQGILI